MDYRMVLLHWIALLLEEVKMVFGWKQGWYWLVSKLFYRVLEGFMYSAIYYGLRRQMPFFSLFKNKIRDKVIVGRGGNRKHRISQIVDLSLIHFAAQPFLINLNLMSFV